MNDKIHVFTVDYRGFGHSTGDPSETGLITDGIALVNYILGLGIPSSRVILLGQSLGTQVASAVALHFADPAASARLLPASIDLDPTLRPSPSPEGTDFASVILVASFPSLPKLLLTYRISGLIPVLSPLRVYPYLQNLLTGFLRDTWPTSLRLAALTTAAAKEGRRLRLHILHAHDDWDISYHLSEENFHACKIALSKTTTEGTSVRSRGAAGETRRKDVWLGDADAPGEARLKLILEILVTGGESLALYYNHKRDEKY